MRWIRCSIWVEGSVSPEREGCRRQEKGEKWVKTRVKPAKCLLRRAFTEAYRQNVSTPNNENLHWDYKKYMGLTSDENACTQPRSQGLSSYRPLERTRPRPRFAIFAFAFLRSLRRFLKYIMSFTEPHNLQQLEFLLSDDR